MNRRPSRMPRHLWWRTWLLTALLLAASVGCGEATARIAVVLPETGPAASYGVSLRRGIELAHAAHQASGGLELELVFADSASDPSRAANLAEELLEEGAMIVLGGATSAEALAMVPAADRFDRILLSPSASSPELTGISSNFFRVFPSDSLEATRMASFASQTLTFTEVAVVAEERVFSRGIQDVFVREFERYGGTVLEAVAFPSNTTDFDDIAARVTTLAPPGVYLVGFDVSVAQMILALDDAGYPGKILTTHALASPASLARVGPPAEGVILTQTVFEATSNDAHIRAFADTFQQTHDVAPDVFAAHGYDALMVIAKALTGRSSATSDIRRGLRSIAAFPGVTGAIQFDERGDVRKFPRVYIVAGDLALHDYDAYVLAQKNAFIDRLDALRNPEPDAP